MKIVVVDDHPLVGEGLKNVLQSTRDMELVGHAGNGQEAEQLFKAMQPDIALVDLRLPGERGIDTIKKGKSLVPGCRFVVLTSYASPEDVKEAVDTGVYGYILKEALPEEMISALRLVARGRRYIDPGVMQLVIQAGRGGDGLSRLTEREREVLRALAYGLSNKKISQLMCVTEDTVKKHVSSILAKLDLKDRTQAALYAIDHGMGKPVTGR